MRQIQKTISEGERIKVRNCTMYFKRKDYTRAFGLKPEHGTQFAGSISSGLLLIVLDCYCLFQVVWGCSGSLLFLQKMPNLVIWEQKVIIRCDFWSPLYVVIAVLQVLLLEIGLQLIYLQSLYQIQINSLGIPYVKYRALSILWEKIVYKFVCEVFGVTCTKIR